MDLLACATLCLVACGHATSTPPPLFYPGALLTDTDGNIIRAHQPHVYSENGSYYLLGSAHVGESDGTPGIVNLYTSDDLHAWTFQGGVYNHTADARASLVGQCLCSTRGGTAPHGGPLHTQRTAQHEGGRRYFFYTDVFANSTLMGFIVLLAFTRQKQSQGSTLRWRIQSRSSSTLHLPTRTPPEAM